MSETAPDEGFLAGDQPRQRHSLAGLPLGGAAPADELLHPPAASGHYSATETSYYGFNIPERRVNGEIYLWFHPVLKVMSASIYVWTGFKASSLACEYVNHHHYLPWPQADIADFTVDAVNLRIRVIEPLKSIQIEFHDRARGVHLSYRLDAIMPPGVRPGGWHFTQAMRTQGELDLYGDIMTIDGYFSRDRSWGQERREDPMPLPPLTWMAGVFDSDLAFHVLAMDDPAMGPDWSAAFPTMTAGQNLFWGYLWKDGELVPVKSARKLTTREADGLAPRLIDMEIEDIKGRTLPLLGTVQARMPWQTWQNMNTYFCQTRWETAGRVGYGDSQDVQFGDFVRRFARDPA
jgi:hypothetical protein